MPILFFGMNDLLRFWIGDNYVEYAFSGTSLFLDPLEIQRRAAAGEEIIIRRLPNELVERVTKLTPFIHDNSFAAAILSHTDN